MTKVITSTEVLLNYIQGSSAAPDEKFNAVQTPDGHTVLFTIGSGDVLYLTEEMVGTSTGWIQNDISSKSNMVDFFPPETAIVVKDFAVSQPDNQAAGVSTFCLLAVVTVSDNDHLFMATNYIRDENKKVQITWTPVNYDDIPQLTELRKKDISGLILKETLGSTLVVVDMVGNDGKIMRFYVDVRGVLKAYTTKKWLYYNIPVDFSGNTEADPVIVVPGRASGATVDGLYTLAKQASGAKLIVYQALFNEVNPTSSAGIATLKMPNTSIVPQNMATAMTVTKSLTTSNKNTDLYVTTTDGELYVFLANNQSHMSTAQKITSSPLFKGVEQLFAFRTNEQVTIWGRNSSHQVFYIQCGIENNTYSSLGWTYPMAIEANAVQISPYVNRKNGGNTYFLNLGNEKFQKVFQDPKSTLWQSQYINLPSDKTAAPKEINTYTTKITLQDVFNNAIPNANILLSSSYRLPVAINNKYFVLDTEPIQVAADGNGKVTIIQTVNDDLTGSCLYVQTMQNVELDLNKPPIYVAESGIKLINPMDKSNDKLLALDSSASIESAVITSDDGKTQEALVPPSDADTEGAANAMKEMDNSNKSLTENTTAAPAPKMSKKMRLAFISHQAYIVRKNGKISYKLHPTRQAKNEGQPSYKEEDEGIFVAAGDLFRRIKTRVETAVIRIKNVATNVWHFICEIGGEVLKFVVDCIEQVANAIQAIMEAIGSGIKKLVQFVKFLFSWDDIKVTAQVFAQIIKVFMNETIYSFDGVKLKAAVAVAMGTAKGVITEWSGISEDPTVPPQPPKTVPENSCPTFDQAGNKSNGTSSPTTSTSSSSASTSTDTSSDTSCSDDYLQDQLTNNVDGAELQGSVVPMSASDESALEQVMAQLKELLKDVGDDVWVAFNEFYDELLKDFKFRGMSIMTVLQKSIGILANMVLSLAEDVLDCIIDILVIIVRSLGDALTTGIWIPILSPILERFFDIKLPSAIDLLAYVGAMPATMGYKLRHKEAPYAIGDPVTDAILALKTDVSTKEEAQEAFDALCGIINPAVLPQSSNQPSKKSAHADAKYKFFTASKTITFLNDNIAALLGLPIPELKEMGLRKELTFANNLVKVTLDKAVSYLATPSPAILGDKKYENVLRAGQILTQMHILEKAGLYGFLILHRVGKGGVGNENFLDLIKEIVDKVEPLANAAIYFSLLAVPVTTVYEVVSNGDNFDGVEFIGCLDAGVQFGMTANAFLGLADILPEKAPSATATTVLKATKAICAGVNSGVCFVSSWLRFGEMLCADENMF